MPDDEADRIVGVMGNTERFDDEIADLEGAAGGKQPPGNADTILPFRIGRDGFGGEAVGIHRQRAGLAEDAETAGMIGMFVGEDDAANLIELAVDEGEALGNLATAETGVDEQPRRIGFDQGAIAGAATTQNRDVHPHGGDSTPCAV